MGNGMTIKPIDAASLLPLPATHYNGCGDGSEPLWTEEQMIDYANACIETYMRAQPAAPAHGNIDNYKRVFGSEEVAILEGESAHGNAELISNQNARFAIDGAIQYGRQGTNRPPTEDHWLAPYWNIGRNLAAFERGLLNLTDADVVNRMEAAGFVQEYVLSQHTAHFVGNMDEARALLHSTANADVRDAEPLTLTEEQINKIVADCTTSTNCPRECEFTDGHNVAEQVIAAITTQAKEQDK